MPLPVLLGASWPSLMVLGLQKPHPHLRLHLHMAFCVCACPQCPLFVRIAAILDLGSLAPSILTNCIFNDLISKEGQHPEVLGVRILYIRKFKKFNLSYKVSLLKFESVIKSP